MSTGAHPPSRSDTPPDWLDQLLAREAADHAGDYIADGGFTARVMQTLPAADTLPAWRRPVIVALWLAAAALARDNAPRNGARRRARGVQLFAARPFSLSTLALALGRSASPTWTGAAVALRRD